MEDMVLLLRSWQFGEGVTLHGGQGRLWEASDVNSSCVL